MANLYTETIDQNTFLVGEINGYKCKNINALHAELRETFRWPIHEHPADAMYNLDWCKELNFKIIVKKFNSIKDNHQKHLIISYLDSYKKHWDEIRLKDPIEDIFLVEYR